MPVDQKTKVKLRRAVRYLYDLQKLRISTGNRDTTRTVELEPEDLAFLTRSAEGLKALEHEMEKEVKAILKTVPVYKSFLKGVKGVGPRMAGVLLAEFDISKSTTVSKMWAYSGLHTVEGKAPKRRRGETCGFNPWLRAKLLKVLGESFIKSNSPYRKYYDDYKHRKESMRVATCTACQGKGKLKQKVETEEGKANGKSKIVICANCEGTGGPAPWGNSKMHRHMASIRYMVKMFLADLWEAWRVEEGLPVRVPYKEEYLSEHHAE